MIARLARSQHGVVGLTQLLELGLTPDRVQHRLRVGRLIVVHRGVYAVGHGAISRHGRYSAATLVAPGATLSHRSAAELWGIADPRGGAIHFTAASKGKRRRGLAAHLSALPADERTVRHGIPVTTLARTLLDLAGSEGRRAFERALREASFARLTDPLGLPALIARYPRRRGNAVVAAVLAEGAYAKRLRSPLEADFLDFLRDRGLPLPETNAVVELGGRRYEVDCLWRERDLVVELDGLAHADPERREEDLRRDGALHAEGLSVHRVTSRRLRHDGDGLDAQLRLALRLPRPA